MKLSKTSIFYRASQNLFAILFFVALTGGFSIEPSIVSILASLTLFSAIVIAVIGWQYLYWRNYNFFLDKEGLDIESGVIRKNKRDIPLKRVQNVDIGRNIFQRMFGIAKLNFETAGGNATEASLRYVSVEQAKDIQKQMRELKTDKEAEEELTEEEKQEKLKGDVIYEMGGKELGLLALFSVNLRSWIFTSLLIIFSVGFSEFNVLFNILLLIIAPLALLFVFIGFSLVSTISRYYSFTLTKRDNSLDYERGLFQKYSGSIPLDKVQNYRIEENPLFRFFGYSSLKVETAGYSMEKVAQEGVESAIPLAQRKRVIELIISLSDYKLETTQDIPKRSRLRYTARYSILLSVVMIATNLINSYGYGPSYLYLLAFVPIIPVAAHLKWLNIGYRAENNYFVSKNGFWKRKTVIMPYYRIQNLMISRSYLQRRWNLSSLILDTASGYHFGSTSRAVDIDKERAEELMSKVFKNFQKSLTKK